MLATPTARQSAGAEIDLTPRPVRVLVRDLDLPYTEQWYFTLDPHRVETMEERRARYLTDDRLVHLGGLATISGRAYSFMKKLSSDAGVRRRTLRSLSPIDERYYDELVVQRVELAETDPAAADKLAHELRKMDSLRDQSPDIAYINVLREQMLTALPEPIEGGTAPLWRASTLFHFSNRVKWLDDWYEPEKKDPPGRRPGSKNRRKSPPPHS